MIVQSLWITRKSDPPGMLPEMIEAWDELSIDENREGYEEACVKALAAVGDDVAEFRYLNFEVPGKALLEAFRPTIKVEIDIPPSQVEVTHK
jgi:hypothetical protein